MLGKIVQEVHKVNDNINVLQEQGCTRYESSTLLMMMIVMIMVVMIYLGDTISSQLI